MVKKENSLDTLELAITKTGPIWMIVFQSFLSVLALCLCGIPALSLWFFDWYFDPATFWQKSVFFVFVILPHLVFLVITVAFFFLVIMALWFEDKKEKKAKMESDE